MDAVKYPLYGYRPKTKYTAGDYTILSENSSRPEKFVLSAYYAPKMMPMYDTAQKWAIQRNMFPGNYDEMIDLVPEDKFKYL